MSICWFFIQSNAGGLNLLLFFVFIQLKVIGEGGDPEAHDDDDDEHH